MQLLIQKENSIFPSTPGTVAVFPEAEESATALYPTTAIIFCAFMQSRAIKSHIKITDKYISNLGT